MALPLANKPLRLIAERGPGSRNWSTCLEDEPQQGCGGSTVSNAVRRWLALNRDRFPGPYAMRLDKQQSTLDRCVVLLTVTSTCSECGGSGRYVGLTLVENCKTCHGSGLVSSEMTVK
jgi:hypothetical protein